MTKREDIIAPRVTRRVLPPDELYTVDIQTGKKIKKLVWCEYHKDWEWINDFYTESETRAKHKYDVREEYKIVQFFQLQHLKYKLLH